MHTPSWLKLNAESRHLGTTTNGDIAKLFVFILAYAFSVVVRRVFRG